MRQQLLDPVGTESVAGVVRRLGAVPAQFDAAAELAVRARRQRSRSGEVARALAEGRIIETFAFRGATHLVTPEDGGAYLALRAASRMWELPSWQSFYGLTPSDWPPLRQAIREALADGPMARDELGAAVTARPKFRHLGFAFADRAGTLLKPLAWQADMSFGPPRDGRATFQRLDRNPRVVKALLGRFGVPGTFKDVPINQPKGDKVAAYGARFRRDNPNGFQIEVRGRRAVVVWLPNK
jgi:hypothetical protein